MPVETVDVCAAGSLFLDRRLFYGDEPFQSSVVYGSEGHPQGLVTEL